MTRKNILGGKIEKLSKNKILYGYYAGTKIINHFEWSKTDLSAKYLGTYESQLQKKIVFLSKKFKLRNFIDLVQPKAIILLVYCIKAFF